MLNIYRASAGSGKTHQLTKEYIKLLFNPNRERAYRRILAVTFTNKATDEMKSRILKELHALAKGKESLYREDLMKNFNLNEEGIQSRASKVLIEILHDYSSFSISTIDKFFQQIIRSFAREIGVQGGYNIELDNDNILQQSIDNLFIDLSKPENKQLLNWLTQFAEERIEQSENWNPRRSIEDLGKEIFKENYQNKAEEMNLKLHNHEFLSGYRNKLNEIQKDFEAKVKTTASESLNILKNYGLTTESFKGGSHSPMKTLDKLMNNKYELSATFLAMIDDITNCYAKSTSKPTITSIENAYNNGLLTNMQLLKNLFDEDFIYYNSAILILKHINTFGILSDLAMQIKKLTDEQNSMLISDVNMFLNRIIDNSETPFIFEKTGIYTDNFMIDEFQDTSILQWKNFFTLISNSLSSNNFNLVVGDVKQSIYRWRNSDWKILDEQLTNEFRPDQFREINLDTNRRSNKNIIEFNNEFFRCAAVLLQQQLNENIKPLKKTYPQLEALNHRILHAYGHLHQKTNDKPGSGVVNITFIKKDENEEGWKSESLNRLPALLEDLQTRGYRPGDVAILVKKNVEAQDVIHKLLTYKNSLDAKPEFKYDIMGNEGLLISSAASVRFIVGILKLMINPADMIQQVAVNFEYSRFCLLKTEAEALSLCFAEYNENGINLLFNNYEKEIFNNLKQNSLYETVEQIIALFKLGSWPHQAVFVQAFQDVILNFTSAKNGDLYKFIKWWDKNGLNQSISTPENADAFRIMTIHKSKGLDFKVVIMPFCEWDINIKSGFHQNILWCEPNKEPFNELPILPVDYSPKLANSIFAENYFDELMHQYIDNLNVAYVAFTRAEHELFCMSPLIEGKSESANNINSIAGLMLHCFQHTIPKNNEFNVEENLKNQQNINLTDYFNAEISTFESGKPTIHEIMNKNNDEMNEKTNFYPSINVGKRLQIRHKWFENAPENQQIADNRLNFGLIMHDILQKMVYRSDEQIAVNEMIREGRINHNEGILVLRELEKFWAIPETADWFAHDVEVLNETTIITPHGELYRPDRVVIKNNKATVIDYKFGYFETTQHNEQVKSYMNLISEMDYEVSGFLCYVTLGKVIAL